LLAPRKIISALLKDQRIRFLIVGIINTAVGYGCFAVGIFVGLHYFIAHIIATVIGVTCSYFLNKYFTFKQYEKSWHEVVRFISVYCVSFVLGSVILYCLIDLLKIRPYIAGGVKLILTIILSWFGHKYFSFRKSRQEST